MAKTKIIMTINREHFEAWLFSQPKDKQLNYVQGSPESQPGCLFCNYFRDNFKERFSVDADFLYDNDDEAEPIPYWAIRMLRFISHDNNRDVVFTIAEAQAEYLKLFPDTVPALPVHDAGVAPEPVKVSANLE